MMRDAAQEDAIFCGIYVPVFLTFQQKAVLKRERARKMLVDYSGKKCLGIRVFKYTVRYRRNSFKKQRREMRNCISRSDGI